MLVINKIKCYFKFNQPLWQDILAFFAGVMLVFAFAPYHYNELAIISCLILLLTWRHASPRRACWRGWLFGVGLFSVGSWWVYISIHTYGHLHWLLAIFLTGLFISLVSIFPALQGYLQRRIRHRSDITRYLIIFPSLWLLSELARGWTLSGFPWFYLGVSQVNHPLGNFLPIIGTHGVSFLICFIAGLLGLLLHFYQSRITKSAVLPSLNKTKALVATLMLSIIAISSLGLQNTEWTSKLDKTLAISLLQGNISQDIKWDQQQAYNTLQTYLEMIEESVNSDLIIIPESGITLPPEYIPEYMEAIDQMTSQHQASLVLGIPLFSEDYQHFYNGILVKGQDSGSYYKRHLVLFGEYVPFQPLLSWFMDKLGIPTPKLLSGNTRQANLKLQDTVIAPLICIETAYPSYLHHQLPEAKLLLTITDDSWFGHSLSNDQHLQIGQALAKQTGRYLIQASNTGKTAVINHQGQIVQQIPAFQKDILTARVETLEGRTPWLFIEQHAWLKALFSLSLLLIMLLL